MENLFITIPMIIILLNGIFALSNMICPSKVNEEIVRYSKK